MELEYGFAKEVLEHLKSNTPLPDLIGRRIGFTQPKLPGFYHVHHLHDYSVKYMDPDLCTEFDTSLEEIQNLGDQFQAVVTHPEDIPRVRSALFSLAASGDESKILAFFQRIRLRPDGPDGYNLVLTSVKINLTEKTFICISNTTDQLLVFSTKVCNALNQRFETKQNLQKFIQLSPREKEVFSHLAAGSTAQQVAERLVISAHTVMQHKKNLYRKLEINTVAELITIYQSLNLSA